jgi:hypothetical protein
MGSEEHFPSTHSSRRINALATALKAQKYLEIGVWRGKTFMNVLVRNKDGVDPQFEFDTNSYQSDVVSFFPTTSDVFFTHHASKKYDLIFLDGLHTFEQTLRDFCSSLSFSHKRTVWLIDDTVPSDIFSVHRNPQVAVQTRAAHGIKNTSWHGDVFKLVPFIHDFFPQMNYVTVKNGIENPQTLVWFGPRKAFSPQFNRLESIERIDYFQFRELERIYNFYLNENDVVAEIVKSLGDE